MKPFLILQLRPEEEASDDEFRAMLDKGGLGEARAHIACASNARTCPRRISMPMPG